MREDVCLVHMGFMDVADVLYSVIIALFEVTLFQTWLNFLLFAPNKDGWMAEITEAEDGSHTNAGRRILGRAQPGGM